MIDQEQIKLIQGSFRLVMPRAEELAGLFYQRLFELDPTLRPLFKIPLIEQERKFIDMLCIVVYGLEHETQLLPALHRLGQRHVAYLVKPQYYKTVGVALLAALEQTLDAAYTPEIAQAWLNIYTFLADTMQSSLKA